MFDLRVTKLFFDTKRVKRAVDRARRAALSKGGAFIRQRAKSSIRKRKDPSPPGQPPSSHVGWLRKFLFFSYDEATDSAVIGPVGRVQGGGIPHTLEFGGKVRTRKATRIRVKSGRDRKGRFKKDRVVNVAAGTVMNYRPRPYMGPALKEEERNLPRHWANSVKGG